MQVVDALSSCEDLCLELSSEDDEIRCVSKIKDVDYLILRMLRAGYECTQLQKDYEHNRCVTWFCARQPNNNV